MSQASDKVVVGKIGAPYGVKGWLKIHSFTEQAETIFDYQPWLIGDKSIIVDQWRLQGKSLVAKLDGIETREEADFIKNAEVSIDASLLPDLGEEEFYWRDLQGMQVVTLDGYNLGVVQDVFNTGANDVLQVKANAKDAFGQRERLLPFVYDEVIHNVDTEEKVITVEWDPGF